MPESAVSQLQVGLTEPNRVQVCSWVPLLQNSIMKNILLLAHRFRPTPVEAGEHELLLVHTCLGGRLG
jgi:hypothetical protein